MIGPGTSHARSVIAAVVAVVSVLSSGCSTFTNNDVAAEVNGDVLTVDEFQSLAGDLVQTDPIGEFLGSDSRGVLTRWVTAGMLRDALAAGGVTTDEAARQAAEQQLSQTATWAANSEFTKSFLIGELATQSAVAVDVTPMTDEQLQALYESGAQVTGVLCIRVIATQTPEDTQEVIDRLAAGDDFAVVADDLLDPTIDPAAVPPGGIYLDPESGSECISAPEAIIGAFTGAISDVAGPIDAGNGTALFILQRPFAEIEPTLRSIADSALASQVSAARPAKIDELIATGAATADVTIDSRYGMWDAGSGTVVPTR